MTLDGQVSLAQSYDPFGMLLEAAGDGTSRFGYTGEQWSSDILLLYLRARWYDPLVGRFLAKDRLTRDVNHPQKHNAWSYVENNPINLVDPTGLYSMQEIKGFFYNAPTYRDVLRYFEYGGGLEDRWGWLEVLRKAEDGSRINVFQASPNICAPGVIEYYGGTYDVREDLSGRFRKVGDELFIITEIPPYKRSHFEVASEGTLYRLDSTPQIDLNSNYRVLTSHVNPTQKYMGLRRDPALAPDVWPYPYPLHALLDLLGVLAANPGEDLYVAMNKFIADAPSQDLVGPAGEFTQEASRSFIIAVAATINAPAAGVMEAIDKWDELNELVHDLGYVWEP